MIKFFNTLSGKIEPFRPISGNEVGLYTCGPTVYDFAHIGNFRSYTFEDLLKRFLFFMGYSVRHVMNITDIDDKTIRGARERNISLAEYTETYIQAFFNDIDTLKIARADFYPKATEHIPEMIEMIKGLLAKGYAYRKDGSTYFNIGKFKDYGKLSKINRDELKTGVRIDSDEYEKESVHDFALWKARKDDEFYWESDLGPGRPGWHIECSVMSAKYLGDSFDIHCGGVDNIFPHHENEIAQSEAYSGRKFVNTWLHCHHLIVDGEKMSKSKGNYYTIQDLTARGYNPLAIRLLLLSTHYRKQLNFTLTALDQAQSAVNRLHEFIDQLTNTDFPPGKNQEVEALTDDTIKKFKAGLSDDLNISPALTALFEMVKKTNILLSKKQVKNKDVSLLLNTVASINKVLAVIKFPDHFQVESELTPGNQAHLRLSKRILPEDIEIKIREREKARKEKNYALADAIREELRAQGILLEDTKDGVRWKRER